MFIEIQELGGSLPTSLIGLIGLTILAIGGFLGKYWGDYKTKKAQTDSEIELAKIEKSKFDSEDQKEAIKELQGMITNLNGLLDEQRVLNNKIQSQLQSIRSAFDIFYEHYQKKEETDPGEAAMLESLRTTITTET